MFLLQNIGNSPSIIWIIVTAYAASYLIFSFEVINVSFNDLTLFYDFDERCVLGFMSLFKWSTLFHSYLVSSSNYSKKNELIQGDTILVV